MIDLPHEYLSRASRCARFNARLIPSVPCSLVSLCSYRQATRPVRNARPSKGVWLRASWCIILTGLRSRSEDKGTKNRSRCGCSDRVQYIFGDLRCSEFNAIDVRLRYCLSNGIVASLIGTQEVIGDSGHVIILAEGLNTLVARIFCRIRIAGICSKIATRPEEPKSFLGG